MHCGAGLSVDGSCFCPMSYCGERCDEPCRVQQWLTLHVVLLFIVYVFYALLNELA